MLHGLTPGGNGSSVGSLYFCGPSTYQQPVLSERYEYVCRNGLVSGSTHYVPAIANLGVVELGQFIERAVTIRNTGTVRIEGDLVATCPEFTVTGSPSVGIDPGQTASVTVRFTPTCDDVEFGELAIGTNYYTLLQGTGRSGKLVWGSPTAVSTGGFSACPYTSTIDEADSTIVGGATHVDVTADLTTGTLYFAKWTSGGTANGIWKSNLDGSALSLLIPGGKPWSVALDPAGQKIYWNDKNMTGNIYRANMADGSSLEPVLPVAADDLIIDPAARQIYWTERVVPAGSAKIMRAGLVAGGLQTLITQPGTTPIQLALDPSAGKIYWTRGSAVQRMNTDGTNVQTLLTPGLVNAVDLAVEPSSYLYWNDTGTNSIHRVSLGGTNPMEFFTGTSGLTGLAIVSPPAHDPDRIFWTDGTDMVRSVLKDGTNLQSPVPTGLMDPRDIALDVDAGKMYWVDLGSDKVQRANFDGSALQDLVTGLTFPNGIALDIAGGKMYWTDAKQNPSIIRRANLDGSSAETLLSLGNAASPRGIALDVSHGKMYWADANTPEKIQRANLNGTNVENLVTTGLDFPTDVALDINAGKMYWLDSGTRKIQRSNLNGSNVEDLISVGLVTPRYLDLDLGARKLYWTDAGTGKVQRANLDGSGIEDVVTGQANPQGIAVVTRADFPTPSDVTDRPLPQSRVQLEVPYPNPFNPTTAVSFVHAGGALSLRIYTVGGHLVRTLAQGEHPEGRHTLHWDGTDERGAQAASGIYLVKLQSAGQGRTAKAVLLR